LPVHDEVAGMPQLRQWGTIEPGISRMVNGIPYRMDRNRALGNSVVPSVVARAWVTLTKRLAAQTPRPPGPHPD
jgi:hypothetical protein